MNLKKNIFILTSVFFLFNSCTLFGNSNIPYLAFGEMTMDDSDDYFIAGLNLIITNKEDKAISSFTMVFFVFDEDGNVPVIGKNNIVLGIEKTIKPGKTLECCISLDEYLFEIPENPYSIDYLYISKIVYEDGSTFEDSLGVKCFK